MIQNINIGLLSALNLLILFSYQWYIVNYFGTGTETDAFFASMTLPLLILNIVNSSLISIIVPALAKEPKKYQQKQAWKLIAKIGLHTSILAIALGFTTHIWSKLLFFGFDQKTLDIVVDLTGIQLLAMVLTMTSSVQYAFYNARDSFAYPELISVLSGLASLILLYFLLPEFGIIIATWLYAAKFAIQILILSYGLGLPSLNHDKNIPDINIWRKIRTLIIGNIYYKSDMLVDRYLLSSAASGSLSLYYLAQQIYGSLSQILGKALISPSIPLLSRYHAKKEKNLFLSTYKKKLYILTATSILALITNLLIWNSSSTYLSTLGSLSGSDIYNLSNLFFWLSGFFFGAVLGQMSASAFYACGDASTPTKISMVMYTMYLPLKVISYLYWGVSGLAISTSVYYLMNASLLTIGFIIKK